MEKKKTVYYTTPIYYVNDKPHIGHAYTTILCDTFARFSRFMERDTFFLTGTDEHGEKVFKAAEAKGITPLEHTDQMAPRFQNLWKELNIQNDDFIRTTQKRHTEVVQEVITRLHEKGDIYLGKYKGWYSRRSETFYTESQLVDGKCPDSGGEVELIEEDNYFFKMSKYQDWLIDYIKQNPGFILPVSKEKEVLGFMKEPLEDLCISRPKERLSWGIPIPFDQGHVLYVWFDALLNYLTAIGYLRDDSFYEKWPADIHFMAKDILRHHAIYWPIMLHAMEVPLPKCVFAHGFWTMEGEKMSKSVGNIAEPHEITDIYGNDTLRYFFLKEVTMGTDGAYANEYVANRFNTDLANDLGNLVHRSFSMLVKYYEGVLPENKEKVDDTEIKKTALDLLPQLKSAIEEKKDPRAAMLAIWNFIGLANKFIEEHQPWKLAKDPDKKDTLDSFMAVLLEMVRFMCVSLKPFLPETSEKMAGFLQLDFNGLSYRDLESWGALMSGTRLQKGDPLFPKLEE